MNEYKTLSYPKSRLATFDVGIIGRKKHHITGLIEIDITEARKKIREKVKSGENISFNSWIIKTIGTVIHENRYIHAINTKNQKQVVFDEIDISIPIEMDVAGTKVPLAAVIRNVESKSINEITREINNLKEERIGSEKDYVLGKKKNTGLNTIFFNLPQWIRLIIWKIILSSPFSIKKNMGTAMITNIGTSGNINGWIIPKSIHNLSFALGSINKKPWAAGNEIKIREILHLTVLFDHDAVDGVPAAKFINKLVRKMEIPDNLN